MTDGVPDVDLDAVRREGLLPTRGTEPAQHDGTGRVDIRFTVDTGPDAPATQRQRARYRLGREMAAETGHHGGLVCGHCAPVANGD